MQVFRLLFNLFFPKLCPACNNPLTTGESIVCVSCLHSLPYCNYHHIKNNKTEQIFYGRVKISFASSLLVFHKNGLTQNLIHNLKYFGQQEIGGLLGEILADQLISAGRSEFDYIIGIPLHKNKLKKRGFNQVDTFGTALAKRFNAVYSEENLVRKDFTSTQTKKSRQERWKNVKEIFALEDPSQFVNCKVALIDDVVTTGATMEACIRQLETVEGIEISVLTMAITE